MKYKTLKLLNLKHRILSLIMNSSMLKKNFFLLHRALFLIAFETTTYIFFFGSKKRNIPEIFAKNIRYFCNFLPILLYFGVFPDIFNLVQGKYFGGNPIFLMTSSAVFTNICKTAEKYRVLPRCFSSFSTAAIYISGRYPI